MHHNKLEVENPGGLYGRITIDDLGKVSADTRNPFIAGGLEVLIDTENSFSGIPTIRDEMKAAGLLPAIFESKRGIFKVALYNQPVDQKVNATAASDLDIPEKIIYFCIVPRSRGDIAAYLGIKS
ncbi:MAG: ATP-binding protein [Actinomycetota bacterium]